MKFIQVVLFTHGNNGNFTLPSIRKMFTFQKKVVAYLILSSFEIHIKKYSSNLFSICSSTIASQLFYLIGPWVDYELEESVNFLL